jgi:hypothetical protein
VSHVLSPALRATPPFASFATPTPASRAAFIETPLWIINSNYDSCQLNGCELNLPDVNKGWGAFTAAEVAAAEAYRGAFMAALAPLLAAPRNGGFVDACLLHCQAGTSNWCVRRESRALHLPPAHAAPLAPFACRWETKVSPQGGGAAVPPNLAFQAWYYNSSGAGGEWWIDSCQTPPCNPTC